eukprot:TRINITY_DN16881_c0_g5_i1.p2 TRINITY_DN16881_c0_g5~~TRINITY_DN16881_c0_g5_i1.p2  ORF type:complete len:498 (-),score=139.78 TRINITY_DN16881_c0_g5_i1:84-1472(-)
MLPRRSGAAAGARALRQAALAVGAALLLAAAGADGFAIVGYAPDYRFGVLDWPSVVKRTTHLVLFSVEPTGEGEFKGSEQFARIMQAGSPLHSALEAAAAHGQNVPKVLLSVGGAGRSSNFEQLAKEQKSRKRMAKELAKLVLTVPMLAGIDLDWEVPKGAEQYRDLGKLATDIRGAFKKLQKEEAWGQREAPLLTMTYHPLLGGVQAFAGLQSKSGTRFVDLFDMCHGMAYSKYDEKRRHSSFQIAEATLQEWHSAGLPLSRLTLGLPFFGVGKATGEGVPYADLVAKESRLLKTPGEDENGDGSIYFNGPSMLAKKVAMAARENIAGVMIWELGHDHRDRNGEGVLLQAVWGAARRAGKVPGGGGGLDGWISWLTDGYTFAYDDLAILCIASVIGAWLTFQVMFGPEVPHRAWQKDRLERLPPKPRPRPQAPQREEQEAEEVEPGDANGDDAAEEPPAEE